MEQSHAEEVFNLPDLRFIQFCEWKFKLNRGIYNNIDNWFYEQGVTKIVDRRRAVIQFLFFIGSNDRKTKFGSGGLKNRLEEFWQQSNRDSTELVEQI